MVDDDGDFSNATMYNPAIAYSNGVITVNDISTTMIPADDTKYLTLVSLAATTPLPVALTAFTAQQQGSLVQLSWTTASEYNNAFFVIQRSADGAQWQQIGNIAGEGNSSQSVNYRYTDAQPLAGIAYYRLKQTDLDGTYEYSPTAVVRQQAATSSLRIYPNPVSNEIIIESSKADLQQLKVFDLQGREVTHKLLTVSSGENITVFNMARMPNGVYVFRINNKSYKVLKK